MHHFDRNAYYTAWRDRIAQELRAVADQFYNEVLRCL
jgi:hypothetical protein